MLFLECKLSRVEGLDSRRRAAGGLDSRRRATGGLESRRRLVPKDPGLRWRLVPLVRRQNILLKQNNKNINQIK